jgi:hypothetical protein
MGEQVSQEASDRDRGLLFWGPRLTHFPALPVARASR